jgi:transcriptional regulator with XRE-family HTH domain
MAKDLAAMGKTLEERRREAGISRAEIARRVDVSTNYIWTVERARARKSGEPSQPSKDVLQRWIAALGWDDDAHRRMVMELAGHGEPSAAIMAKPPLLARGGFNFPTLSHQEDEMLLDEFRQLLRMSDLSSTQRVEVRHLMRSFVAWLHFMYQTNK